MIPNIQTIQTESSRQLVPGGETSILIGPGFTRLREFMMFSAGVTLDHIEKIELAIDGVTYRSFSGYKYSGGRQLDVYNRYNGVPTYENGSGKILTLSHVREGLRRFVETMVTAIGMGAGGPKQLELKITMASNAPATSSVTIVSQVTAPTPTTMLLMEKSETRTFVADGEQEIHDIVKGKESLESIYLWQDDLSIDNVEAWVGSRNIWKRSKLLNNHIVGLSKFKSVQSDLFVFDKSENGFGKEPLTLTPQADFKLKCQLSGISGSGNISVQRRILMPYGA